MRRNSFLSILIALFSGLFILAMPGCSSDDPVTQEPKPEPKPEPENVDFPFPDLRWFDTRDMIVAFEEGQGSKLVQEDKEMGYMLFSTKFDNVPQIGYVMGMAIQMYTDSATLVSDKFIAFMKEKGFTTDGKNNNGYVSYKSSWSTINAYALLRTQQIEGGELKPGMCFTYVAPVLKAIPYPMLKWDASQDEIKKYEKEQGYELISNNTDKYNHKVITFNKKEEKKEFTEMFAHRYIFDGDKLIKVSLIIAPPGYVMTIYEGGFMTSQDFETLVRNEGYKSERKSQEVDGKKVEFQVYSNQEKKIKFTLVPWKINLNGNNGCGAAGLDFVPFDGPDLVNG